MLLKRKNSTILKMKLSKLISNSSICDIERKGRKKDNSKNVNINNDKDNDNDNDKDNDKDNLIAI